MADPIDPLRRKAPIPGDVRGVNAGRRVGERRRKDKVGPERDSRDAPDPEPDPDTEDGDEGSKRVDIRA